MRMTLEQARDMKHSLGWTAVVGEIDERINVEMSKLIQCNAENLHAIQMRVRVYEELKNLPQDVIEREDSGA